MFWKSNIIACSGGEQGKNLGLLETANFIHTKVVLHNEELNLLKPNDIYICHTAALTSRRYILNIYSTNIHTEYFKHAA